MKLSHKSYFQSELRVRVRRILRLRGEEGNAVFEFAMVLPLLSMLLVGIIYGGITFYDYVTLADAVAVGAQAMRTNRGAGTGPPNCLLRWVKPLSTMRPRTSSQGRSPSRPRRFTGPGGSTCSALVAGDYVTVTATYPCSLTIPFAGINLCPVQNAGGSFISSDDFVAHRMRWNMNSPSTGCITGRSGKSSSWWRPCWSAFWGWRPCHSISVLLCTPSANCKPRRMRQRLRARWIFPTTYPQPRP